MLNSTDPTQLTHLLDDLLTQSQSLLVQKTQMGSTEGYIGSVPLEWVAQRVQFAAELPLFQHKFDPKTHNIIRDAETLEQLQQRPLDWSRQASLVQYLAVRRHHKFPALLVVVSPHWCDDPDGVEWDGNGQAKQSSATFTPLDRAATTGLLNLEDNISLFALDGQHRLLGIQGLIKLLQTGRLDRYTKTKKITGPALTLDGLSQAYDIERESLQTLSQETIAVEFIPAVLPGETHEAAKRRVRSIFVHVNLMAERLSKGQLTLLNEDNGFAITARQLAISHPLLRESPQHPPRVNWDSGTVSSNSTALTTLQALEDMATCYLSPPYPYWKPGEKGLIPLRPDSEELDAGLSQLQTLFDYLATLPSYRQLEDGIPTPELRHFSHEKEGGDGNLLFRPVGQVALVQALGSLVYQSSLSLEEVFQKLRRFDAGGGFSGMDYPQSLWYGVLYNPSRKRIQVSGKSLASQLIVYLILGSRDEFATIKLRTQFAKARTLAEDQAINLAGTLVSPKEIELPNAI
ncbi:DGQHR domain-containing protein [Spirulina sp. CS-785/01]|uniref:DGQHR domain-containing protein n=1 Tax=Spirulina sp. CS-785/01 TaxID=3021716 RepID=UPI00232E5F5D|nr:DGQHR domain-containing protein [Spirulina sp. CS-785/01]MDB9316022.1 DGQHR domain-containing protein [Spirulina sp. CS-785/01]